MTAQTFKLHVNLSASQARKRLKGRGLGVRRVEASGRNQAVIMHTATGSHLRDLEALLADVIRPAAPTSEEIPIQNLKNLGPASAAMLREIGIETKADLERFGPALAYRLVKQHQPGASLNLLWAIAGALKDRDWRELSDHDKQALLQAVGRD